MPIWEDVLFVLVVGTALLLVGRMFYRAYLKWDRAHRNPVEEAKDRLRVAEMEVEAAKLNAQADKIVGGLYEEEINAPRVEMQRVVSDDEAVEALDEQMDKIEKGKRHHG
jgi:hypothetical protein